MRLLRPHRIPQLQWKRPREDYKRRGTVIRRKKGAPDKDVEEKNKEEELTLSTLFKE